MLVHDLIFDSAKRFGSRRALIHGNDAVDYSELKALVESTAAGMIETGVRPGDRIAVYLSKRIEGVIAYFAASAAGAVFVPVNPVLKPAQVQHILNDCDVTMVLTSSSQALAMSDAWPEVPSLRFLVHVDDLSDELPLPGSIQSIPWCELSASTRTKMGIARRIDNDIAAILYTSGSTGLPKGVVLSQRNMVNGAVTVAGYLENSPSDVILSALPLSFDAGFSQLTTGFRAGSAVVLLDYLLPQDVIKAVTRYGVTGLTGVPPLWNQLVKSSWPEDATCNMRYIANTGGAMPAATLGKLRKLLPDTKVYLMYGLTEAFRSTYLPPEQVDKRPTSIGKAIPDAEILVVRKDGSLCDPGEPGELVHRGALVSLGYWNDPARTAERFRPVPNQCQELSHPEIAVWSGDTVVMDEEGYLYFVGRQDDMIKSSGYRISPTEVEEVIYGTGLVTECAALGVPHDELGQAVVIAAHSQTADDETRDAIILKCKRALPNFMVPSMIVWRETMPKNPNGKIDRKRLTSELQHLFQDNGE